MLSLTKAEINPCKRSTFLLSFFSSPSTDVPRLAVSSLLPSGKVKAGWIPAPALSACDRYYEHHHIRHEEDSFFYKSRLTGQYYCYRFLNEVQPPLGLSAVPNCHKTVKKHGLQGITALGRERVKESSYLLERRYRRRLGFYTLTCPYTDEESIYLYNKNISYIQRSYFQELKREFNRKGVTWSYVAVIEIQALRFLDTGIPVLHIHYISPCYVPGSWEFILDADTLRSIWQRVLGNALGRTCDCSASVDAQVICKSAAGYLAKYLSKGGHSYEFLAQNAPSQFPSQWWSTSRNVRKALKETTVVLPSQISQDILEGRAFDPNHPAYLQYHRYIYVHWKDTEICVGISAQMSPFVTSNFQDFRGKLDFL